MTNERPPPPILFEILQVSNPCCCPKKRAATRRPFLKAIVRQCDFQISCPHSWTPGHGYECSALGAARARCTATSGIRDCTVGFHFGSHTKPRTRIFLLHRRPRGCMQRRDRYLADASREPANQKGRRDLSSPPMTPKAIRAFTHCCRMGSPIFP